MEIQNEIIEIESKNDIKEIKDGQESVKVLDLTADPLPLQENEAVVDISTTDSPTAHNGFKGHKGRKRAKATSSKEKNQTTAITTSQAEKPLDSDPPTPSPRDIFSNLTLESIETPAFPSSEVVEFPLRSSSLHDWNILHDVRSLNNFLPLPPSFWLDDIPDTVTESPRGNCTNPPGLQIHELTELTYSQASLPPESSPLPLLSITNSRSWSPVNSPSPRTPMIPTTPISTPTASDAPLNDELQVLDKNSRENEIPRRNMDDDEKAMNSFIHKFLHMTSSVTMESYGEISQRSHKGREFIASLPPLSSIHTSSPALYPSPISFPLPQSSCRYKNPISLATGSNLNSDDHSLTSDHTIALPSDKHYHSPDDTTTTIDFSEYFSPDEINDIMTLVRDDPETFLPIEETTSVLPPPAAPPVTTPATTPSPPSLISDQSTQLSSLTLYRTTVPKRGRKKRKFDTQPSPRAPRKSTSSPVAEQEDSVTKPKQRRKSTQSQRASTSRPTQQHPGDEFYVPHPQGNGNLGSSSYTSLYPQTSAVNVDSNLTKSSFFSLSYPPLGSSNPEGKLQGLVGLKLVLNSVTKPPFSHLVPRSHPNGSSNMSLPSYQPSSNHPNHVSTAAAVGSRDHSGSESQSPPIES
jgi:hypothetical protein